MKVQVFKNETFGELKTLIRNKEPWFFGKEVAKVLGYANDREALSRHVEAEDKAVVKHDTPGGEQMMTIINESGLYSLILKSNLPKAKQFKHWVTSEVLPTIRKHGMFVAEELMNNPDFMITTFQKLKREMEEKNKLKQQLLLDQPYTEFGKALIPCKKAILLGEYAKLLKNAGIDIGQNRLFAWMRLHGYLIERGLRRNQPMQQYIDQGLFIVKENVMHVSGEKKIIITPLLTGKGQAYFLEKLLKIAG